jgi:hypothetical protein
VFFFDKAILGTHCISRNFVICVAILKVVTVTCTCNSDMGNKRGVQFFFVQEEREEKSIKFSLGIDVT